MKRIKRHIINTVQQGVGAGKRSFVFDRQIFVKAEIDPSSTALSQTAYT
jgi:hypothetical protein